MKGLSVIKGNLKELEAIAAAVIGGVVLTGGFGTIGGIILGTIIFGIAKEAFFYIPGIDGKVIGLTKLNRIVEFYARRPQVQENLTMQIHNHINRVCEQNEGVAVMLEANHMCACVRGVKHDSIMTVSYTHLTLPTNREV